MTKATPMKITYATMGAEQLDELHREIDRAIGEAPATFGREHPMSIGGKPVRASQQFDDRSPIDTRILLGRFQQGNREHVQEAIASARRAYPTWTARPWQERVQLLRNVADAIRRHRWELSALMGYEAGKSRLECVGDVEESADLIAYYCDQMESHQGFVTRMGSLGPNEENLSVLRSYGVWAVISPFNFPLALAAGPAGAALVAGNTVVFKPASSTPMLGLKFYEMTVEAGLPEGVFNFVTGPGGTAGAELVENPGVDGIVFTGSKEVGNVADSRQCVARDSTSAGHRDGRQESRHRHAIGGPGHSERRGYAVGVRRAGAKMLGLLAHLRGPNSQIRFCAAAGRENRGDQDWQPARSRYLDGTCH